MRRSSLVAALALMTAACGGAEKGAFGGTWTGTRSVAPVGDGGAGPTAFVPGMLVAIGDDGHGSLRLNGLVPARVTSATTFEALPVTFATTYGPGYQGPGRGTTTVTGGSGRLTATGGLSITLDFAEDEGGTVTTYRATYTLERGGVGAGSSL